VGVATLLGAAALVIGPLRTADFLGVNSVILLAIAIVGVMPMMFNIFEDAYLMGRGVVRDSQIVDITMLAVGLGVYALLWSQHRLTVLTALAVWLVQFVIIASLKAWRARRRSPHGRWTLAPVWAQGRAYALKSWAGNTVNMLSLRQDVVLLAMQAGPTQVGIYTIGVAAAELAWYVPNALQGVATAKFAAEEDSLELAQRLNRSIWPFTLVFSLFILLVAVPLIPLVYGGAFKASIAPLVLLLPGILATSMSTSLSAWLSGRGHPEDPAIANGVNMGVNLVANLLLDKPLGASGAAIASSLSYAAGSALIIWRFHKRSGSSWHEVLVPRRSDLTSMAGVITGAIQRRIGGRGKVNDS
jgi:O-antigen/teichoic acid export membrane protein